MVKRSTHFLFRQLIICLLLTGSSWAQSVHFSLDDLIRIALSSNPQIEIARQQYSGSNAIVTQARSRYLPHLSTGADYGRTHVDGLQPVDEDNVGQGLLQATQLIFDFGRTTGLIDTTTLNRDAAAENYRQVLHDIVFRVKSGYYSVLEKQRLITVAEQAVKNYEQQRYRAQKYYEAGVRTRIDVTNAEVNLSNQKLRLLRANADLKSARVSLENTLGAVPNNGDYDLVAQEPGLDSLAGSKPQMPGPLEALLQTAQENRPGLKRFSLLVEAAQASLTQAKGDYWPSIDAVGNYTKYETDLPNLTDQWRVGIGLRWEFFSGFETDGKVAEAGARLREVQAGLREFELSVKQDVTDSYLRADENREGVDIAAQTLALSLENLELADGRYKAGIGDILEYNDALLLYIENQANLVNTFYAYLIALARIERATGIIPQVDEVLLPPE